MNCVADDSPPPMALVVSGVSAPDLFGRAPENYRYNLPHEAFVEYLQTLDGTPEEFFAHPELMQMMLPVLRADFEICDTYRYQPEPALDVPIRALFGVDDHSVGRERMQAWSAHTLASFDFSEHPGGHFFVNHQWPLVGNVLNGVLMTTD